MADNRITFTFEINDKGKIKIQELGQSFKGLDKALDATKRKIKETADTFDEFDDAIDPAIGNAGLAGATLTELGRTISDLPFGIRGVANNLSQLSTLFITLVAKSKDGGKSINGVSAALKLLGSQLKGPLGIILAFQTVIALFDAMAQGKIPFLNKKTKEAADEFSNLALSIGDVRKQIELLNDASQELADDGFGGQVGTVAAGAALAELLDETLGPSLQAISELFESLRTARLNEASEQTTESTLAVLNAEDKLNKALLERAKARLPLAKDEEQESEIKAQIISLNDKIFNIELKRIRLLKRLNDDSREKVKLLKNELEAEEDLVKFRSTHLEAPILTKDQEKALELLRAGNKARLKEMRDYFSSLNLLRSEDTNNTELSEEAKMRAVRNTGAAFEAVGDLLQEVAEGNKGLAITGVIVEKVGAIAKIIANTAIANAKAVTAFPLTAGQPFVGINTATAGISIAATTAAAVKAISGIKSGQDTDIKQSAQSAGSRGAPTFNVVGASGVDQIGQAIAQGRNQPLKAYVVGSEVTNQQDLDNKIINSASIG